MCYHVKFGSSATKGVRINRKEPATFGSAETRPRNTPIHHICYPAEFGRSRSNGTSVIKEIRLKKRLLASRLSRSLKVIGTGTDRYANHDFLLKSHHWQSHAPFPR